MVVYRQLWVGGKTAHPIVKKKDFGKYHKHTTMLLKGLNTRVTPTYFNDLVSLDELKSQLNITTTDTDTLLQLYIYAATDFASEHCWRFFGSGGTYTLSFTGWVEDSILWLPMNPVLSVETVKYYDVDGTLQTLVANTDYVVESAQHPASIYMITEPGLYDSRKYPIIVAYTAGYVATSNIPKTVKQAITMLAATMFEERTDDAIQVSVTPNGITSLKLLSPHTLRIWP